MRSEPHEPNMLEAAAARCMHKGRRWQIVYLHESDVLKRGA